MRNEMNVKELFNNNTKVIKLFLEWCKESQELCEYDYENLCIALELGATNKTTELFHFHKGNILDWLEEQGYYIGLPLRGEFKYITVCHFNEKGNVHQKPFFSNSGVKDRNRAITKGIQKSIEHLEKRL